MKAGVATATAWAQEALTSKAGWEAEIATLKATLAEKQAAAGAVEAEKKVAEEKESVLREEFLKKKAEEDAAREAEEAAKRAAEELPCRQQVRRPQAAAARVATARRKRRRTRRQWPPPKQRWRRRPRRPRTLRARADAAAGFPSEEMPQHPDADGYGEPNAGGGGGGGEGDRVDHLNEWDSEPDEGIIIRGMRRPREEAAPLMMRICMARARGVEDHAHGGHRVGAGSEYGGAGGRARLRAELWRGRGGLSTARRDVAR